MILFAKKPCSFGGKRFAIGEEIPVDLVLNPAAQAKMDVISIVHDTPVILPGGSDDAKIELLTVPVVLHAEEGDFPLNLTFEGLQNVVDVLTTKGDPAKAIVEQMTDGDALILLDATDTRSNIKKAAKARAVALNAEESAGEQ